MCYTSPFKKQNQTKTNQQNNSLAIISLRLLIRDMSVPKVTITLLLEFSLTNSNFLEMIVSILPWFTCRQIFQNTGAYKVKTHFQTAKHKTGQVIHWQNSTCFTIIIAENLAPNMQPLIISTVNCVSTPVCYYIRKSISKTSLTLFTNLLTHSL